MVVLATCVASIGKVHLSNGDIKCENCDEPATKATDKLKFYCGEHYARCSVVGCTADRHQRSDKYGGRLYTA